MEVDITELQKYSRHENLELANIPGHILQNDLEKYIIDILGSINVNIQSFDIAAVHRIGKSNKNNSRNIIVRFTNSKNIILSLKNRCKLKSLNNDQYKRIFIFEHLCPTYKNLFGKLREMKNNGEIFNVWSFNGTVNFKFSENGNINKAYHHSDIEYFLYEDSINPSAPEL